MWCKKKGPDACGEKIWDEARTASLCGHRGRNVAWDFVLERMNREAKQYLGKNPTDEQIAALADVLNTLRHMGPRLEQSMGLRDDDENEGSQYSHVLDVDEAALRAILGAVHPTAVQATHHLHGPVSSPPSPQCKSQ